MMSRVRLIRNANRSIGVIVGCAVLFTASRVFAQDWPQWRGANRDGKVAGFTAPQTWPQALVAEVENDGGLGRCHARPGRRQALCLRPPG